MKQVREWWSVKREKSPERLVIIAILLFNLLFFAFSATAISRLAPEALSNRGFWASIYYTITMVLDAGCIDNVIADVGESGVAIIVVCLSVIIFGMITFTGSVIGYMTNRISSYIDNASSGNRKLNISNHTVILNWNNRASEIVNDLMYSDNAEKLVVLVCEGKEEVEREIQERLLDTIDKEDASLRLHTWDFPVYKKYFYIKKHKTKNRLSVIVREGDTFSTKQLNDISLLSAKAVIILSNAINNSICQYDNQERKQKYEKGNANIVKTLVQVAQITSSQESLDNQRIIVEIDDEWTGNIVRKIIDYKEKKGKCNIVPLPVNEILGQILSQFSIMPELNFVYSELFSNKGAEVFSRRSEVPPDINSYISGYIKTHRQAIPLTFMSDDELVEEYYIACKEKDINIHESVLKDDYFVEINKDYWMETKNVIILGHNSKSTAIMNGFSAFANEWNRSSEEGILNIIVIDDEENLEKVNYYHDYPYIKKIVKAEIFDKEVIVTEINAFIDVNKEDTSVLILSDDMVVTEDLDSSALTYLIYIQEIVNNKIKENPSFDRNTVDIVVEIIDPKNYDVFHNYSANNVVISNRYISKMMTQISDKEAIFNFYCDILTYDGSGSDEYFSKEVYIKKVDEFFKTLPEPCNAHQLIRAVFEATPENNKSIILGYVKPGGKTVLFVGNQMNIPVDLSKEDKIIVFSNH